MKYLLEKETSVKTLPCDVHKMSTFKRKSNKKYVTAIQFLLKKKKSSEHKLLSFGFFLKKYNKASAIRI